VNPDQPVSAGLWSLELTRLNAVQIANSDVVTYHNYGPEADHLQWIQFLRLLGRPLICTEYMARGNGSTFDTVLPVAKRLHIAAINWGLVLGKTQTNLPWDSWVRPYTVIQPQIWFHEVFYGDGRPYREREVEVIRELTGRGR
jgi:hypothetical protein